MAASGGLHISITAEPIFAIGGVTVTNSMFTTWIVTALLIWFSLKTYTHLTKVNFATKPTRFQSFVEMIVESLYNLVKSIAGTHKKARIFLPMIATFFMFILVSNWFGLLPGVGTIGFRHEEEAEHADEVAVIQEDDHEEVEETESHGAFVPYFRGPTADLNTTLALAIISMMTVQIVGFQFMGFAYPKKFFNFKSPIDFFIGILELLSDFSKVISFAFRLFGNIFAGEVLLAVIAFLLPIIAPLPFIGLEIFVGFVQALVFAMLSLVFMNMATIGHGEEEH